MGGECMTHGREANVQMFTGKPEEMSTCGKPYCRWEDSIKIDLKERGRENVD
jgi:hypothetical protein